MLELSNNPGGWWWWCASGGGGGGGEAGPKVLPSDQRQSNYPGNWEQEATGRAAVTFTKMTNRTENMDWLTHTTTPSYQHWLDWLRMKET